MFGFNQTENPTPLEERIASLYSDLSSLDSFTEEYAKVADQLIKLMKLKQETNSPSWTPSPDAVVGGAVSILSILLIMHHEKLGNIFTTKAFGFIGKVR